MRRLAIILLSLLAITACNPIEIGGSRDKKKENPTASSSGEGNFRYSISVKENKLHLKITRMYAEGDYLFVYTIDDDPMLCLEGAPSGGYIYFPAFHNEEAFTLPALSSGKHRIESEVTFEGYLQKATLEFTIDNSIDNLLDDDL